jgi:4-amino-4-deoxy-L-arabinose transferase-like glycosyltransferase
MSGVAALLRGAPPVLPDTGEPQTVLVEPGPARRTPIRPSWSVVAPLLLLLAGSVVLRLADLGSWLWMDEGISIGVASHPLARIPGLLARDGSPPLYYLLLHGWITVFGTSETATHSLSLALALVTIPVALWAGWSLFGRRAGWIFAALMAFSPYLSDFATETRMYGLVTLLALVATASFLHAFAFGRSRYRWLFAASLALVLYTHNWGLWLAGGAVAALVPCALVAPDRRRLLRDAALAFGAAVLAYLPWLPTLLYQARHTGAPWSHRPVPREAVSVVADLLGDPHERVLVALVLVAGPVLWTLLRHRGRMWSSVGALVVLSTVPVALGWVAAQVSPSWVPRYLAVCAPAILLLAALGLSLAGVRGALAIALILVFWIQPFARLSGVHIGGPSDRAAVKPLARAMAAGLHPGDLVVAMQLEELPVLAYYLPPGLRFATALGPVADPGIADWRDALARMRATTADAALRPELDRAAVGSDVLIVCADPESGPRELPWFALMDRHCDEWRAALDADSRFTRVDDGPGLSWVGGDVRQILGYTKTSA